MLTPCRPRGLLVVTESGGNCVAVIDPESPGLVRTLGVPVALTAQGPADCLALCTPGDGARAPAAIGSRALPGTLGFLNPYSGVFPDQGSYSGGTLVTLIGRHFTGATAVRFGARPAPSFAVIDDETIVTVSPPGSGVVPVTVATSGGSAHIGFFYYLSWPGLSGIVPAAGPVGGGNTVALSGINLSTALVVRFGDAVTFPTVVSDRQILVTAPPASGPGTVPVHVTTIGGVSNRLLYTYTAAPSVSRVSPATGPVTGGSTIVLTGTGLARATGVTIGGVPARSFRAYSDTLIVAVTPPGDPGPADISVSTPGGMVTVLNAFGYKAASATAVTSTPDPAVVGQPVSFTATVTGVPPTTGTPSGTVTFDFGDGTAGVTAPVTNGTATVSHAYTGPSEFPYSVTATYSGDLLFLPSTGTDPQVVQQAPTTTTVVSAPDPSLAGQPVTLVARVAPAPPGAGVPSGTVTFDFGDNTPRVTLPVSGGAATVTHAYANAAESPYPVTATYNGDDNFTHSTGTDTQSVQQAGTTTAVDLAPGPSVAGQPVTVTATVTAVPPGAGTPTGTVTFDFGDGTPPVTTPLTNGTTDTTHTYTDTSGSPHSVTATYNGDGNLTPSTGTGSQTVAQASSATNVASAPSTSTVGQPVTFTATVIAVPPGAGTPTGTVTFDFGDGTTAVTTPLTDGTADTVHTYTGASGSPYSV
ncbi:Ig-like domain repeat protein, partial [Streptomyces decoyicus]